MRHRFSVLLLATATLTTACARPEEPITTPGVSHDLALRRAAQLADIRYDLAFTIPERLTDSITGVARIAFRFRDTKVPLVLDFVDPLHRVRSVRSGGDSIAFGTTEEHLVIPPSDLREGENALEIAFTAGDGPLNRNPDFLYTLFVPDRARYAFPLFDQPDLKARYTLTLTIPRGWTAVANGPEISREEHDDGVTIRFAATPPISSYLFAFAAGRFMVEEAERGGRRFRMFHRETDSTKVARNRDAIFDLEAKALVWLEAYTGIPYPFPKFDFVAVPSFQYGGMEHPGAILYRASSLFLEPSATQNEQLGRASLIAHETSHMWFGDLVTMRWFDDVWTKEVFANFMAAKIVNPAFPEIDHALRFLLAHYPAAYAVDRTAGANPIRQPLENLDDAGSLYGAIIYQKAPIVMRHLERRVGDTTFRDGLREYLHRYAFGNASWPDLIAILDARTPGEDLAAWSRVWVEEAGRPTVTTERRVARDGTIDALAFVEADPDDKGRLWPQRLSPLFAYADSVRTFDVSLDSTAVDVPGARGLATPVFIIANGDGLPYGDFVPDTTDLTGLVAHLPDVRDEVVRGAGWLTLWDAMLDGRLPPDTLVATALRMLATEAAEQNAQRVLGDLTETYWRYLPDARRRALAPELERTVWAGLERARTASLKSAYFGAYRSIALTDAAVKRLERIWRKRETVAGLPLAERDYTALALALAVRAVPDWKAILDEQLARITNPDRRARFAFVMPALSADQATRDTFFESLKNARNREHEPWVLEAVSYLNHPLRAASAERYIQPSLELVEEIQRTGDIFFPLGWLDATLDGHNTPSAARIVRGFLDAHAGYPARLRGKILQAADGVFRSAGIVYGER